ESLYDKLRGKELVDPESPYHANQCLYVSEGVEHTPGAATAELGQNGPVFAEVIVRSALKNTNVVSTITLYAQHDRVDLRNELEKAVTSEKQELDFAFPFSVPDRQYRFEAPGAIITPGDDQLPGSGQAVTAVRHFVDVFNSDYGVTLSQADSGLVEFGHRTTTEDPVEPDMSNSTVFAMALDNTFDWNEAIRDQAGDTHFVFRYSLCGHAGNFDPVAAVRFGWDDNNALLSVPLPAGQQGVLPADAHGFVSISKANVVLAGLKTAEEDGLILRLWECAGDDTTAVVSLEGLGPLATARCTDLMEHDLADLMVTGNAVEVNVSARGVTTIRLILE
ncbi:MAG: glycosyl hydrolase-related protein, partial [Anaerolineae bacterium]|nr:glycosyl hydrolase-related protein [Anaerolineae bacterium]